MVRIAAADPQTSMGPPFFHATTSSEWIVTMRFAVPRRTFKESAAALAERLGLVPFIDGTPPVLSDAPRVRKSEHRSGYQEVTITGHALDDFETPAFDEFLKQAVAAHASRGETQAKAKLKRAVEL